MDDRELRRLMHVAADECFSGIDSPPSRYYDIMRKIKGEEKVKKKISMTFAFAIVLTLALAGTAFAASLGLFGHFAGKDDNDWASNKLEHLEAVATTVGETAHASAYPSGIQIGSTTVDSVLTSWDGATFDLTLDQAYCDGQKLYYSYTLTTTGPTARILGHGEPTGIDVWSAEFPGETYESSGIHCGEKDDDMVRAFFAEQGAQNKPAHAVVNHFGLGDGADMMDGTPAMIYDSAEEYIDDRTIHGYQEVELPEGIEIGDTLDFTLAIGYGATIYMQDATGLYMSPIQAEQNRGWIDIPFTVTVDSSAVHLTGAGEIGGHPTEVTLTFSGAEAYGEAIIDGPDTWKAAIESAEERVSGMITSFALSANGMRSENLDGGIGYIGDGRYRITLRFDLPESRENLVLHPVYEDTGVDMNVGIELN